MKKSRKFGELNNMSMRSKNSKVIASTESYSCLQRSKTQRIKEKTAVSMPSTWSGRGNLHVQTTMSNKSVDPCKTLWSLKMNKILIKANHNLNPTNKIAKPQRRTMKQMLKGYVRRIKRYSLQDKWAISNRQKAWLNAKTMILNKDQQLKGKIQTNLKPTKARAWRFSQAREHSNWFRITEMLRLNTIIWREKLWR